MEGRSAGAGVVRVPADRPAVAEGGQRAGRHPRRRCIAIASAAVFATVIGVRIVWVYLFAYLPRLLSARIRDANRADAAQVFVVAWAGMRGVVSLAAAFGVPMTTLSGDAVPRTPASGVPDVRRRGRDAAAARADAAVAHPVARRAERRCQQDALAAAAGAGQGGAGGGRPARRAAGRTGRRPTCTSERPTCCAAGTPGRRNCGVGAAGPRRRGDRREPDRGVPAAAAGNAGGRTRDVHRRARRGRIDDEVLRAVLHGLDLEEATLNRK